MGIKILSDSACDLPKELIQEYSIDILPIVVIKDDKEYLDNITIESKKVYDDMRNGEVYKTAQIPPSVFQERFTEYAQNGDNVIYIAFSSGLSGTYQTSLFVRDEILEKYPKFQLDIIDSKSATVGFGLIVLEAAKMAKEGRTKEEIIKAIEFYVENIEHIFTVDDIEYLFRGGRVSRTQAFFGGLLNIKPVLHVDDGKLVPLEKVRGKNKVFKTMLDIMEKRTSEVELKDQIVGISHGDNIEGAMKLKELISEKFGVETFIINTIGASIGAHSGPGTLAIFFLRERYKDN
ncbi:DegV family protein [Tissierella pigra]|uniref:DegV family protein n=1 Tax=Tissierella pigra TaxID=2607614 RepID=A0A6N7XIJ6_9FIRM|nr:DegV family protein [Tissierella pigra]MBU5425806.1 DegV family protein [Tissierella pigra]MSU01456.1 DegV family protein [Tissierella pigra]